MRLPGAAAHGVVARDVAAPDSGAGGRGQRTGGADMRAQAEDRIEDRVEATAIAFKGHAVCLNDPGGRSGTRIGPTTRHENEARYAARVVRDLLKTLRSAPLRNHVARFGLQRQIGHLGCHNCRADEVRAGTDQEAWDTILEREGRPDRGPGRRDPQRHPADGLRMDRRMVPAPEMARLILWALPHNAKEEEA